MIRNELLHLEQGYAYAAIHPRGGRNVYVTGEPCMACADRACDPSNTRPAPCQWARAHAWHAVRNWGDGAYVKRIPADQL